LNLRPATQTRILRAAELLERLAGPACAIIESSPELIEAFKGAVPGRVEPMERLAEPEPVGPTDAELLAQAAESLGYDTIPLDHEGGAAEAYACELLAFARAALARWGRP
jgi:hypothetical protein